MSASAPAADPCPSCGEMPPREARFCPSCGAALEGAGTTRRPEPPSEETGPVPITVQRAEPRWFGVPPPRLLLGLTGAALAVAIALFATGAWPYGLILLGVAALLLAVFLETVRRRRHDGGTRTADARDRAQSALETWRARSAAASRIRTIRGALARLEPERAEALRDLGDAAYRGEPAAEAAARRRLEEIDRREAELRGELDHALAEAEERIRKARLPVQETIMVLPSEPAPPPDEGTPPRPATVPEPYPPPDEGNPPEPARVPEPSPNPPPPDDV